MLKTSLAAAALLTALLLWGAIPQGAGARSDVLSPTLEALNGGPQLKLRQITPAQRKAAAERLAKTSTSRRLMAVPIPGGTPDYFGPCGNYAFSPSPTVDPVTGRFTGGMRKFVDSLPGLGSDQANNLGQYIPIAIPDTAAYPGSDYYQIGLVDYTQQMHSDLPATKLRGYKDLSPSADGQAHYLGPLIIARRDRPVRLKFTNMLGLGEAGNLFLPVDTTDMGAGMGPDGVNPYTQNRAVVHLHGGFTPWISDGTPHQWITPDGESSTIYTKGDSQQNVPDMPDPGSGSATYYYTNEQSARLMFYHDHAYGMTRLNVYAGEAAGYLLTDVAEENLINSGVLPNLGGVYRYGIPLVIQDKTFVDADRIVNQDPTWNWGATPPVPHTGDLWFPHVYMPNQNPDDQEGASAVGRWDYGPWFWPIFSMVNHPPVDNVPSTPNPSLVPEAFLDTPVVNGTAYPFLKVARRAYRFRILNACNDRYLNLQLYYAEPGHPTEVKMVPAIFKGAYPATWPTDGRDGGVPDPKYIGPDFIQIGAEGGFLPAPVALSSHPVGYEYNRRDITVLNVTNPTLFLGPAERADVIIDFSNVPSGAKVILYNDAPAPVPAFDPRNDYYTGDPDQTDSGGAPSTVPGYGPNTRTVMQFRVSGPKHPSFDVAALQAAFATTDSAQGVFATSQDPVLVPQEGYNSAYNSVFPGDASAYARIDALSMTFAPLGSIVPLTINTTPKAIQELFELNYGRMNATLGVELPFTNSRTQTTIPYGYVDPPTESIDASAVPAAPQLGDGTQIWKITHNGVDTHAIHFHLFNVQLINRVGWDGMVKPPYPNELGWKETVKMNPLEDCIVALRPTAPRLPFEVPDSVRLLDVTMPEGSTGQFMNIDPLTGDPVEVTNELVNFGWEYVWHCHLLGHEENDMMRPMVFNVATDYVTATNAPTDLVATVVSPTQVDLSWADNSPDETGFRIERAPAGGAFAALDTVAADVTAYSDTTVVADTTYNYRVFAVNGSGDSLPTDVVTTTTSIPAAPSGLIAVAPDISPDPPVVNLSWTDNSDSESGFTVQRAANSAFTKNLNAFPVAANVTSYTDNTVVANANYFYRVFASNGIGASLPTKTVLVRPGRRPAAPSDLVFVSSTSDSITIAWTDNSSNEKRFQVQRATAGSAGPWSTVANLPAGTTSYTGKHLLSNHVYLYRVRAGNGWGYSPFSNWTYGRTQP